MLKQIYVSVTALSVTSQNAQLLREDQQHGSLHLSCYMDLDDLFAVETLGVPLDEPSRAESQLLTPFGK